MDDWARRRLLGNWRPRAAFVAHPTSSARSVDHAVARAVTRAPPPSLGRPRATFVDRPPSPARSLARRRSPAAAIVYQVYCTYTDMYDLRKTFH